MVNGVRRAGGLLLLLLLLLSALTGVVAEVWTHASPPDDYPEPFVAAVGVSPGLHISYPCGERVCLQVRSLKNGDHVAVVTNGRVLLPRTRNETGKCTLEVEDARAEVGRQSCWDTLGGFTSYDDAQVLTAPPRRPVQLHCILLSFAEWQLCRTRAPRRVNVTWVEEDGGGVRDDSQHQLRRKNCHHLLTFTPESPQSKRFRCRVTVGRVQTSVEQEIRVSAKQGRRGPGMEVAHDTRGPWAPVVGLAVGVTGSAVLIGAVALFIVARRRTSRQPPVGSSHTASDDLGADDVVYADIILPQGPDRVRGYEFSATEYARIQYK